MPLTRPAPNHARSPRLAVLASLLFLVSPAALPQGQGDANEEVILIEEETSVPAAPSGPPAGPRTPAPTPSDRLPTTDTRGLSLSLDEARLEYGYLTRDANPVEHLGHSQGRFSLGWQPDAPWELRLAGRLDGYLQGDDPELSDLRADYGDSYLRWRTESWRLTVGTQTILWGRLDEVPPSDRLSVVDLTRGILDDLADRRRATPALRWEGFFGNHRLDAVWLPSFRGAELPSLDSVWSPVNRRAGTLLGLPPSPALEELVRNAYFDDDAPGDDGGFGLRYTHGGGNLDTGLTLGNSRQSLPYYRYEPVTNRFVAQYPRSWFAGGDLALQALGGTWRAEALYLEKVPVTRADGRYTTVEALSWGAGAEFFPGDGDARINLQLVGTHLLDPPQVLDRTDPWTLNGSWEAPFAHGRWRAKLRFMAGLDERDWYLNPEIAFLGWEPHEFYLEGHYFDGDSQTVGGFYELNSLISLGWRAKF